MNTKLLLFFFIIAGLSSCSTAYKTGQTPDDVYYSPVPPQDVVRHDNDEDKNVYTSSSEDREIRNRIRDRRWRRYDSYGYDYYYYDYTYYNKYPYNPKYQPSNKYIQPRKVNLGGYKPADNNNDNAKLKELKASGN